MRHFYFHLQTYIPIMTTIFFANSENRRGTSFNPDPRGRPGGGGAGWGGSNDWEEEDDIQVQ